MTAQVEQERPIFPSFEIPYLCHENSYDGGEFSTFPHRQGWKVHRRMTTERARQIKEEIEDYDFDNEDQIIDSLLNGTGDDNSSASNSSASSTREDSAGMATEDSSENLTYLSRVDGGIATDFERVKFVQAWLFFGTLHELEQTTGVDLNINSLLFDISKPEIVLTKGLEKVIQTWIQAEQTHGSVEITKRASRISDCLFEIDIAMSFWSPLNASFEEGKVLFSIMLLRSSLDIALSHLIAMNEQWKTFLSSMDGIEKSTPVWTLAIREGVKDSLLNNGWCQSDISLLADIHLHPSAWLTVCNFTKSTVRDHSICTRSACLAYQVREETYVTKHVDSFCNCSMLVIPGQELVSKLKADIIPQISLELHNDSFDLKVTDSGPYIAISHVWSDGLGNPNENALAECQIRRLYQLANNLQPNSKPQTIKLWIDTLCIPVQREFKEYRNKAIALMAKTYKEAQHILVLDAEILVMSSKLSMIELGLQVLCSGWMRRLWTLQEAALVNSDETSKLHFQFSDGVIDYEILEKGLDISINTELETQICSPIMRAIKYRIPLTPRDESITDNDQISARFAQLFKSLEYRSTSKAQDEPICLASLLSLDTTTISKQLTAEKRMISLYLEMGEIPAEILFVTQQGTGEIINKLSKPGFQWAPKSFLNQSISLRHTMNFKFSSATGQCTPTGLLVKYPGFIFSNHHKSLPEEFLIKENDKYVGFVTGMETSENFSAFWRETCRDMEKVARAALIISGDEDGWEFSPILLVGGVRAVLVSIEAEDERFLYVRVIAQVEFTYGTEISGDWADVVEDGRRVYESSAVPYKTWCIQ